MRWRMIATQNEQYSSLIVFFFFFFFFFFFTQFTQSYPTQNYRETVKAANVLFFLDEMLILPYIVRILLHVFSRYGAHREFVDFRATLTPPRAQLIAQTWKQIAGQSWVITKRFKHLLDVKSLRVGPWYVGRKQNRVYKEDRDVVSKVRSHASLDRIRRHVVLVHVALRARVYADNKQNIY